MKVIRLTSNVSIWYSYKGKIEYEFLGKEEAPASHLIDAILAVGRFYVNELEPLMCFRKVWVSYIRTFLFVKGTLEYPGHI
jgi:hypothetical protein